MRGGPIDLTPFGAVVTALGWLYWLLAAVALTWALRGARPWKVRLLRALPVVLIFGFLPARGYWHAWQIKSRLDASMALFEERCKTAGEKISRTVEGVDGIVWIKWREEYTNRDNFADQWKFNDPYGNDCGLEDCIGGLLRVTEGASLNPEGAKRHSAGYKFVETVDPRDGRRYRYRAALTLDPESVQRKRETGREPEAFQYRFKLDREPITDFSARYGVEWYDISTREEREHWIAGSSLKVIDLQTKEVIAERVGYMIDRGQGSQAGGRSPWLFGVDNACPEFSHEPNASRRGRTGHETLTFARKVLYPSQGD